MIDYSRIPPTTLETLRAWIKEARPLGTQSFCEAVVRNDLVEACRRADHFNQLALCDTVAWLYNNAPNASWGYPEALKIWPLRVKEMANA